MQSGERMGVAFKLASSTRVDCVPPVMLDNKQATRYRLDLTESQLLYLHELMSVDDAEHAEHMSSAHFSELVDMLCYHKQSIDGPPDKG